MHFGFYGDPTYWIIMIGMMVVGGYVAATLKSKFRKYSKIALQNGMSGKEAAETMLADYGIYNVKVVSVKGQLTDHYNPATRTVNLSGEVYNGRSAAAVAVAAHECGHAVQHAKNYNMLQLRTSLVPLQQVSGMIMNFIMMGMFFFAGFMYHGVSNGMLLIIIGCTAVFALFSLVTLPVEFDASKRALTWMEQRGIVNSSEHGMAKDALKWAAMTYVVAAVGAVVQLVYFLSLLSGRDE